MPRTQPRALEALKDSLGHNRGDAHPPQRVQSCGHRSPRRKCEQGMVQSYTATLPGRLFLPATAQSLNSESELAESSLSPLACVPVASSDPLTGIHTRMPSSGPHGRVCMAWPSKTADPAAACTMAKDGLRLQGRRSRPDWIGSTINMQVLITRMEMRRKYCNQLHA